MLFSLPPNSHLRYIMGLGPHVSVVAEGPAYASSRQLQLTKRALASCLREQAWPVLLFIGYLEPRPREFLTAGNEQVEIRTIPGGSSKPAAYNMALREAFSADRDWALVMTHESELSPGSLVVIGNIMERSRGAPRLLVPQDLLTSQPAPIFSVCAINRAMARVIGDFDKDAVGIDWSFLRRMGGRGLRPTYVPEAKVWYRGLPSNGDPWTRYNTV